MLGFAPTSSLPVSTDDQDFTILSGGVAITVPTPPVYSTSNATSYATGAFTPSANSLLVVEVVATDTVAPSPTMTGGGLTWTRLPAALANFDAGSIDSIYAFYALVGGSPVSTTPTFDCSGFPATGAAIFVFQATGHNATNPIAQSVALGQTTSQPNAFAMYGRDANPRNGHVAAWAGQIATTPASSPPVGWTENGDSGYATPTANASSASRNTSKTGMAVQFANATTIWGALAVEINDSTQSDGSYSSSPSAFAATSAFADDATPTLAGGVALSSTSAFADASTESAIGNDTFSATSSFADASILSGVGNDTFTAASAFADASILSGVGAETLSATSALPEASVLTGVAAETLGATSAFADTSLLTCTSTETITCTSAFVDASTLSAVASEALTATSVFVDASLLTCTSTEALACASGMTRASVFSGTSSESLACTSAFADTGLVSASMATPLAGTSAIADAASLSVALAATFPATSGFVKASALTASPSTALSASSSVSEGSVLQAGNASAFAATSLVAESSQLSTAGSLAATATSGFAKTSVLSAVAAETLSAASLVAFTSVLSAAAAELLAATSHIAEDQGGNASLAMALSAHAAIASDAAVSALAAAVVSAASAFAEQRFPTIAADSAFAGSSAIASANILDAVAAVNVVATSVFAEIGDGGVPPAEGWAFLHSVARFTSAAYLHGPGSATVSDASDRAVTTIEGGSVSQVIGSSKRILVTFRDRAGQLADPTTATLTLRTPSITQSLAWPSDPAVVREGLGEFSYLVSFSSLGTYSWRWDATGDLVASTNEAWVQVLPSAVR